MRMHLAIGLGSVVALGFGVAHGDVLMVPSDFLTIQDAIDAASSGDEVHVAAGSYQERIDFLGKSISVIGQGAATTTIDASFANGPVVRFATEEGPSSVIDGFVLRGGAGELFSDPIFGNLRCGGGVFIRSCSPTVRNCTIEENACWGGGGLFATGGTATIINCVIRNNVTEGHGGGMYCLDHATPNIDGCLFYSNDAAWGGGMTCTVNSDAHITNTEFISNITHNVGGGMFIRSSSSPIISDCLFLDNTQVDNPIGVGGGICAYGVGNGGGPCYPEIMHCLFQGNSVTGDGGGLACAYDVHAIVTDCVFSENSSGRDGGGVACMGAHDPDVPSNGTFTDCLFEGNTTSGRGGGFFSRASEPTLEQCVSRGNQADEGGGVSFFESELTSMSNTTVCGNHLDQVSGMYVDGGGNTINDDCPACEGDINGDGVVGVDDLLAIIAAFGPCSGCPADVNHDGVVGVDDILIVLGAWGDC